MSRAIVFLVVLLAACDEFSGPTGGLEVSTEVSPTVARPGERVTITTTVTNTSDHDIRYVFSTYCGFHMFVVENVDGVVVGPPPGINACAAILVPPTFLKPGEHFVGTEQSVPGVTTPGTYQLRGFVFVDGYAWSNRADHPRRLVGSGTVERIKSQPVTIQITP
jgi:hypothetical protein